MILVTGGCGYIGSHLVKRLSEIGEQVVVFDNLSAGSPSALLHNEELIVGDIRDTVSLARLFTTHSFETVYHLAALVNAAESDEKKSEYQLVNEKGSDNLWLAAKSVGVKYYLYSSSAAVYGIPHTRSPLAEDSAINPSNVYGETKYAAERSLIKIIEDSGKYGIFRFFNVGGAEEEGRLGQSRESRAIMQRLFAVANGEVPKVIISGHDYDTADGTVHRDFVHVEDIAMALVVGLAYLKQANNSFTVNLGGGHTTSIKELHSITEEITNRKIPIEYTSKIPGDIDYSLSDISLAGSLLAWHPKRDIRKIVKDGWNAYAKQN